MNIYCFSTLSFAKLQFKSVINKAFHKHGVASFTDAWIETESYLDEQRKLYVASFTDAWIETIYKSVRIYYYIVASFTDAWIETLGINSYFRCSEVASFTDAWIETEFHLLPIELHESHLLQMRGLKPEEVAKRQLIDLVASFTDAWIETEQAQSNKAIK